MLAAAPFLYFESSQLQLHVELQRRTQSTLDEFHQNSVVLDTLRLKTETSTLTPSL